MVFLNIESLINRANEEERRIKMDRIHSETVKSNKKLDTLIDSRDRVDISLKEYEELKRVNKDLLDRLRHAEAILNNIGINADVIPLIVPETVRWYKSEYYPSPFEFKRKVMIEFLMED